MLEFVLRVHLVGAGEHDLAQTLFSVGDFARYFGDEGSPVFGRQAQLRVARCALRAAGCALHVARRTLRPGNPFGSASTFVVSHASRAVAAYIRSGRTRRASGKPPQSDVGSRRGSN